MQAPHSHCHSGHPPRRDGHPRCFRDSNHHPRSLHEIPEAKNRQAVSDEERLEEELVEAKERARRATKYLEELQLDCERLLVEDKANEREIEELKRLEDSAAKVADGPCDMMDEMDDNLYKARLERNEVKSKLNKNKCSILCLQSEKKKLDESTRNSIAEMSMVRDRMIPELEESLAVAKGKEMEMEVRVALVQKEKEMKNKIQVLKEWRHSAEEVLAMLQKELEHQRQKYTNSVFALSELDCETEELSLDFDANQNNRFGILMSFGAVILVGGAAAAALFISKRC